jgi:shikimate kinase
MNIYLIGLPGSGKTTLGKILAKEINYDFIDLDEIIEQNALMFVNEIFSFYGEKNFRIFETDALRSLDVENTVISLGGGIVLNRENKKYLNGLVIFINSSLDIIEERLKTNPRPILKTNTLMDLYLDRIKKYHDFAHIIVNDYNDIDLTIKELILKIKEYKNEDFSN